MPISSLLVRGFHGSRVHVGTEALTQSLDRGIRLEGSRCANNPVLLLKQALARGSSEDRLSRLVSDANIAAEILGQSLQKFVLDRPRAPIRRRLIEL